MKYDTITLGEWDAPQGKNCLGVEIWKKRN